jgi:hypothetical protein
MNKPKKTSRLPSWMKKLFVFLAVVVLFKILFWGSIQRKLYYFGADWLTLWPLTLGLGPAHIEDEAKKFDNNDFPSIAFEDTTPATFKDPDLVVRPQGPFFFSVKIDRGPKAWDMRYAPDRDHILFTVVKGSGVVKTLGDDKKIWDDFITHQTSTLIDDQSGNLIAVFYPSRFCSKPVIEVTAQVMGNPKLTNTLDFQYKTSPLPMADFHQALQKFVDWHNRLLDIDRTETTINNWNLAAVPGASMTPSPTPTPMVCTVKKRVITQYGHSIHGEPLTEASRWTGPYAEQPWGETPSSVVVYSYFPQTHSFQFSYHDKDTGLVNRGFGIMSGSPVLVFDNQYQQIEGNWFRASSRFGQSENRTKVVLDADH